MPKTTTTKATTKEKPDRRKTPARSKGAPGISDDIIARRAFEFYCERGGDHGRDVDDWLQAERELRSSGGASA